MCEAVHPADILAVDIIGRFESLDLGGEFYLEWFRVAKRYIVDAGLAGNEIFPCCSHVQTERGEGAYSSYYNSTIFAVNCSDLLVFWMILGNVAD